MKNEFFNPDDCPFEVLGFYEDLIDAETSKCYGHRRVEAPTRPLGAAGMGEVFTITENLELTKGHRTVILKASSEKPKRVVGRICILCGHVKGKK